jgi:energy-coupling factor transport system ATP-binding protein
VHEALHFDLSFLVMQDSDYQLFTESVEEELYLGNKKKETLVIKGRSLLSRMKLDGFSDRHPASLSGGQKQRLCIAVAYMKDAGIVCFDEPTSGLDYESMIGVSTLLGEMAGSGKIVIVTTHDYEFLLSACTHICVLDAHGISDVFAVNDRPPAEIFNVMTDVSR